MVESAKKSPKKTNPSEDHMITMQKLITKKTFDLETLESLPTNPPKKHIIPKRPKPSVPWSRFVAFFWGWLRPPTFNDRILIIGIKKPIIGLMSLSPIVWKFHGSLDPIAHLNKQHVPTKKICQVTAVKIANAKDWKNGWRKNPRDGKQVVFAENILGRDIQSVDFIINP